MDKTDMAVRIAKTVAVVAGLCSSDVDDECGCRSLTDGIPAKQTTSVEEWIAQKIEVVLWHVFAFIMKAFDRIVEND